MNFTDWIYAIIGGYLLIMGLTGINLTLIWITFTLRIKFIDMEYLYGRTGARIIFILLGILILVFRFVIVKYLFSFAGDGLSLLPIEMIKPI